MLQNNLTGFEIWLLNELNTFSNIYFSLENKNSSYVTNSILKSIAEHGRDNHKYQVCYSGGRKEGFENGWLYDLIWYTEDERGNLKTLELALELEQKANLQDIKYDFEKLLVTNSKLRIMICLAGQQDTTDLMNYFEKAVMSYEFVPKGTRFYILIWDDWMGDGSFIPHVVTKQ